MRVSILPKEQLEAIQKCAKLLNPHQVEAPT
ncbi:unnamed protein product, partial [Rotaria sordida]